MQGEKRYDAKDLDTVLSGQQTDTKVCNERDENNLQHHYNQNHQKKSSIRYSKVTGFSISGETGSFAGITIARSLPTARSRSSKGRSGAMDAPTKCSTSLPVLFFS